MSITKVSKFVIEDSSITFDKLDVLPGNNGSILSVNANNELVLTSAYATTDIESITASMFLHSNHTNVSVSYVGSSGELRLDVPSTNLSAYALKSELFSGSYNDLTNTPTIPTVPTNISAFTNDSGYLTTHQDLSSYALKTELFSGSYNDLSDVPELVVSYNDLTDTPTIPTVPTNVSAFINDSGYLTDDTMLTDYGLLTDPSVYGNGSNVSSSITNVSSFNNDAGYISSTNTPVSTFANDAGYITGISLDEVDDVSLSSVTLSVNDFLVYNGLAWVNMPLQINYNDIINPPSIPSITGLATQTYVDNKISDLVGGADAAFDTLKEIQDAMATDAEVANAINSLSIPTVPTNISAFSNDSNYVVDTELATVAFSGLYNDLLLKPALFSGSWDDLTNKPPLFSGSYHDLTNKPTLFDSQYESLIGAPVGLSDFENDGGYVTYTATGTISPDTDNTWNLGSETKQWAIIYGHEVEATYADLAERYAADVPYDMGTVLVFGGESEVTACTMDTDVRVAGIVSINPGLKLNSSAGNSETHPYIALKGRVPCKVIGPVKKGDLLVTSDTPGYARSCGGVDMGHAVLGKALETNLSGGEKQIEVFVV